MIKKDVLFADVSRKEGAMRYASFKITEVHDSTMLASPWKKENSLFPSLRARLSLRRAFRGDRFTITLCH